MSVKPVDMHLASVRYIAALERAKQAFDEIGESMQECSDAARALDHARHGRPLPEDVLAAQAIARARGIRP